jgi:hypothetical protein
MKRGRVSPCEDGSQKTVHLLKPELCRREKEPWRLRGQKVIVIAILEGDMIRAVATAGRMDPNPGVNQASGVARIYFPL